MRSTQAIPFYKRNTETTILKRKKSKTKRFADGKVSLPYKQFLGYKKGADNLPEIDEEEAKIVRLIYRLFLQGKTPASICKHLENEKILSPSGKEKWSKSTVSSILSNEKYKEDALLQKKFTVDFLQKKMKVNEGEVQQYYVENSHPNIIDPNEWDMVQSELARRKELGKSYSCNSIFSTKLICEECGGFYGQKVWHSTDQYRKVIWRCNNKFKGDDKCATPTLEIETIKNMFLTAYNKLMGSRESVIADCKLMCEALSDFTAIDTGIEKVKGEIENITQLVQACVQENASSAQSQERYEKRYKGLIDKYNNMTTTLNISIQKRTEQENQIKAITSFIKSLQTQPLILNEWDDTIFTVLVNKCIVHKDGYITFEFNSGCKIKVKS